MREKAVHEFEALSTHGGDIYAHARLMKRGPEDFTDFSSNTHVFAADLTDKLVRSTPYPYEHYPDTLCHEFRAAVAAHEGIDPDCILPGNGSVDLIWLAMNALTPRRVLLIGPMFSEYARACAALDIPYDIITPPQENEFICGPAELHQIWNSPADLAVLCTPNNPGAVTYPNIQAMFDMLRVPRVLVDNTYREFLWGEPEYAENSLRRYAAWMRPGVTVFSLCSFTKFFACPGLRLGYLAGDPKHLRRFARIQPPRSVSAFAQNLGVRFLEHLDGYRERLAPMRAERTDLARSLRRLACFDPDRVFEGASFITCGLVPGINAATVRNALARRNILVRDCDSIPGMPSGYIRLQVRPHTDNEALLNVLDWHSERGW